MRGGAKLTKEELIERQKKLDEQILKSRKEIKSDRMDMSFGEIINMYENGEIIINPEFQRTFRWDEERQTKFIESVLLGIPIPPIFVAEDSRNVWELVDGLQRLSTILSFFGSLKDKRKNNLVLKKASILTELEDITIDTLPLNYKLLLKRAVCRVEVIRFDSEFDMRYELFNRLNTGGAELSEQEIRNCIFRGYDNKFNAFLSELGSRVDFQNVVWIREAEKERMYYQELILRYFTLKNKGAKFETNIQEHMDKYMLEMSKGPELFAFEEEKNIFDRVISLVASLDENIFKLARLNFSTSMYDSIMINFSKHLDYLETMTKEQILAKIDNLRNSEDFRENTGPASSSRSRINAKIELAEKYFMPEE